MELTGNSGGQGRRSPISGEVHFGVSYFYPVLKQHVMGETVTRLKINS